MEGKNCFCPASNDVKYCVQTTIKSDKWNFVLLLFLYTLQGIFKGLIHSVPLILQENGASYEQQVNTYINECW